MSHGSTPITQYWHTADQPEGIRAAVASFPEHNPLAPHVVFDEERAEALIAANFTARELEAFRACGIPTMQADYFRYCAVYVRGGIYVDADMRCVRETTLLGADPATRGVLFGRHEPIPKQEAEAYGWRYPVGPYRAVGNGMFGFREPGDPLLEFAIDVATANIENRIADGPRGVWLTAGPGIFTSVYLLRELGSTRAFRDYVEGSLLEPSADLFCDLAERHARVPALLDGVEIRPRSTLHSWIEELAVPRPGVHWMSVEDTIFSS